MCPLLSKANARQISDIIISHILLESFFLLSLSISSHLSLSPSPRLTIGTPSGAAASSKKHIQHPVKKIPHFFRFFFVLSLSFTRCKSVWVINFISYNFSRRVYALRGHLYIQFQSTFVFIIEIEWRDVRYIFAHSLGASSLPVSSSFSVYVGCSRFACVAIPSNR